MSSLTDSRGNSHQRFRQRKRSEMVCRKGRIPTLHTVRGAHLVDARIVDQACDWKTEFDDLLGRTPHTHDIRQVALDWYRAATLSLDGLPPIIELFAVTKENRTLRSPSHGHRDSRMKCILSSIRSFACRRN